MSELGVLWALIRSTWGERLSRPLIGILAVVFCASKISLAVYSHELDDPSLFLTLMFAAGSVGRDVTSGVLPLIFTRPVARRTYVLAKWIAAGAAAGMVSALTLVVQALLLWHRGAPVPGSEISAAIFASFTSAFGIASVIVLLSVLVPGIGDMALWAALLLVGSLSAKVAPQRFVQEWHAFLEPTLEWGAASGTNLAGWFRVVSYLSTVTLCLCLAVMAANRKEISYAAG